jgi:hypothetical protein
MASYGLRAAQYKMLTLPPEEQNSLKATQEYIEDLERCLLDAKKWELFFDTAFLHAALASVYDIFHFFFLVFFCLFCFLFFDGKYKVQSGSIT